MDRLLDSDLPPHLIEENTHLPEISRLDTTAEDRSSRSPRDDPDRGAGGPNFHRPPGEDSQLLSWPANDDDVLGVVDPEGEGMNYLHGNDHQREVESKNTERGINTVIAAIYTHWAASFLFLVGKLVLLVLTNSLSILANFADTALDFVSTAIVWKLTEAIAQQDQSYPVGQRSLEPLGVVIFSVIMVATFIQVAFECLVHLVYKDQDRVHLNTSAIVITAAIVFVKAACTIRFRSSKHPSVRALAYDTITEIGVTVLAIGFPFGTYVVMLSSILVSISLTPLSIAEMYSGVWWIDAVGGLVLSIYTISKWSYACFDHIRVIIGQPATGDDYTVLLYLTMRFSTSIKQIQHLRAYHSGDKLHVDVAIALEAETTLRDSHALVESLQYFMEMIPKVERAHVWAEPPLVRNAYSFVQHQSLGKRQIHAKYAST